MAKLKLEKPFKFAKDGIVVVEYRPGEYAVPEDMPERAAEIAVEEGLGVFKRTAGKRAAAKK